MITQYLEQAVAVIPNEQLLINIVSQRVKQLNKGHRPLVETTPRMPALAIALKEIAEGKISFEPSDTPIF
ncbi:MAG: DNA-directed RNA polymerase subunit omega [Verrucomicrobiia bacterium]